MKPTAQELFNKAKALAVSPDDNFWELGKVLAKLRDQDQGRLQQLWNDKRIGRRRAYYLIEIVERFSGLPVKSPRLKAIGWTKLQLIAPYVTAANADEMVGHAEKLTAQQLKRLLAAEKPPDKPHCFLMYLDDAEFDLLTAALVPFGASLEGRTLKNKEEALLKLLADAAGKKKGSTK